MEKQIILEKAYMYHDTVVQMMDPLTDLLMDLKSDFPGRVLYDSIEKEIIFVPHVSCLKSNQ